MKTHLLLNCKYRFANTKYKKIYIFFNLLLLLFSPQATADIRAYISTGPQILSFKNSENTSFRRLNDEEYYKPDGLLLPVSLGVYFDIIDKSMMGLAFNSSLREYTNISSNSNFEVSISNYTLSFINYWGKRLGSGVLTQYGIGIQKYNIHNINNFDSSINKDGSGTSYDLLLGYSFDISKNCYLHVAIQHEKMVFNHDIKVDVTSIKIGVIFGNIPFLGFPL